MQCQYVETKAYKEIIEITTYYLGDSKDETDMGGSAIIAIRQYWSKGQGNRQQRIISLKNA